MARCGVVFERPKDLRDIGHESVPNCACRAGYLRRLRGWDDDARSDLRRGKKRSRVMLDESYCHKNPVVGKTWHDPTQFVEVRQRQACTQHPRTPNHAPPRSACHPHFTVHTPSKRAPE